MQTNQKNNAKIVDIGHFRKIIENINLQVGPIMLLVGARDTLRLNIWNKSVFRFTMKLKMTIGAVNSRPKISQATKYLQEV